MADRPRPLEKFELTLHLERHDDDTFSARLVGEINGAAYGGVSERVPPEKLRGAIDEVLVAWLDFLMRLAPGADRLAPLTLGSALAQLRKHGVLVPPELRENLTDPEAARG